MWYVTDANLAERVPTLGTQQQHHQQQSTSATEDEQDDDDDEAGTTTLFRLKVSSIKLGALRLALGMYLMGVDPPKTWQINQSDEGEKPFLHAIFKDHTGMVSIQFTDQYINIKRHVEGPSLAYLLQESVLLHGVLDEIENLAYGYKGGTSELDGPIAIEDRLLILVDPLNAIEQARSTLPARRA